MLRISEDSFYETFKPQQNHLDDNAPFDGAMYETYGDEALYANHINRVSPKKVWTIIEGDEGMQYITGKHWVNRLGYFICEVEWEEETVVDIEFDHQQEDTDLDLIEWAYYRYHKKSGSMARGGEIKRGEMEEWFYEHDNEWQNDLEIDHQQED